MRRSVHRFSKVTLLAAGLFCVVPMLMAVSGDIQAAYVHLYRNNNVESNLSKLATKRSNSAAVKKFAKQVMSENRNSGGEMMAYAVKYNFRLLQEIPESAKAAEKQMKSLNGNAFDKVYLVQMDAFVKDDQKVAAELSASDDESASALGKEAATEADARAKQIDQLTEAEGFRIQ